MLYPLWQVNDSLAATLEEFFCYLFLAGTIRSGEPTGENNVKTIL
jgi:hypothetical protein